ncbi:MAG: hypothetical protein GY814_14625 [Gammaproteobacteria bacterium]|nr:hypothetical protein [Gammaproteobacteria bacterium]
METEVQLNYLKHLGCQKIQGYLFGRPATATKTREMLQEQSKLSPPPYSEAITNGKVSPMKIQKVLNI